MAQFENNRKDHVASEHKNWKEEVGKEKVVSKQSPHSNPNWLPDLKANCKRIIISNCSKRARDAVDADENITVIFTGLKKKNF